MGHHDHCRTRSHHVLVEKRVLLLDAEPGLQAWGGIERFARLGASVGGDRLAGGQAGLAQDQHVVTSAEGILSRDCSRSNGDARARILTNEISRSCLNCYTR